MEIEAVASADDNTLKAFVDADPINDADTGDNEVAVTEVKEEEEQGVKAHDRTETAFVLAVRLVLGVLTKEAGEHSLSAVQM